MIPEQKAKELVEKYKEIEIGCEGFHSWGMADWQAKQCALIAVEEKKETLLSVIGSQKHMWTFNEKWLFDDLQKVKEAIEKL